MSFFRWIFAIAVLSVWTALIGTALYVALYEPSDEPPTGDVIIVLGGDADPSGALNEQTATRVTAAAALFRAEAATQIVMAGGDGVAEAMRIMAAADGVPPEAILVETASRSTLQNALFTADIEGLDKDSAILLVTHKYHLPRANASFRWAGFSNVINVPADAESEFRFSQNLMWESVKWPYNILRAAAASAAMAGNVPRENFIKYLE